MKRTRRSNLERIEDLRKNPEKIRRFFKMKKTQGLEFPVKPGHEFLCFIFYFLTPTNKATSVPSP